MTRKPRSGPGIHRALLKPYRIASLLAAGALLISLAFVAYTAWATAQRLAPFGPHQAHLQALQQASFDVQELLAEEVEENRAPQPAQLHHIAARLESLVAGADHLDPETPGTLVKAAGLLEGKGEGVEGLLSALTTLRRALLSETTLQRAAADAARRSAEAEFAVAAAAMFLVPLAGILFLAHVRRRALGPLGELSEMLENVGNLEFRTLGPREPGDPLGDVFARYNAMTQRLKQALAAASERQETLERQVRAASEALLRQQSKLAEGARMAALGEFSARVAHELRNPLSGIAVALRNLEDEMADADRRERVRLVIEEMDRVERLLATLLKRSRGGPERPVATDARRLVDDVVRLFRYQVPDGVDIHTSVEMGECLLPQDTVRQILLNLLRNSAEAIGTGPGEINVALACTGEGLRLTITDTGPGYPDDLLKSGIQPFRTGKGEGTGLGLAVVQRLARAVGGGVELARGAEGGARTTVDLPVRGDIHAHDDDHRGREAPRN